MNPNYPQTTETLVLTHIDENGKQYTVSRVIKSKHPSLEPTNQTYEKAQELAYEDLNKLKEEQ